MGAKLDSAPSAWQNRWATVQFNNIFYINPRQLGCATFLSPITELIRVGRGTIFYFISGMYAILFFQFPRKTI
jgi:hypothetical protein